MADLIYHKEYTVHAFETDTRGLARPVALLNFLQDAAGEHAGRLGWSVVDLGKRRLTWVLSRYHVLFHRYPALGERLEVVTWPSGRRGLFALRDFEMAGGAGEAVLSATSSWMVIGLEEKRAVRIDDVIGPGFAVERRAIDDPFASLPVPDGRDSAVGFRVEAGHLDGNRHVNNAVYVQWALEGVPAEVLMALRPAEIEVSYRAEALYGEEVISAVRSVPGDGRESVFHHQVLNRATGVELARLRTRWK